ncbi:hypothetical protein Rhopal_007205-T1 [Rhodotorula paludigena]|uniref:Allantoin permease n=1 Tax=Rhodotorula paludigena TaxID=86838 RepID=A0AAV5GP50_9BASI|nr:hypothetical protein Rhopal_007205-T1 [Rhodotorula paludigena]
MEGLRSRAVALKRAVTTKEGFKQERTWTSWHYGAMWAAYGLSTGVWALGSSMIAAGLTAGQAVGVVFVAHMLGSIVIVINSRGGATYHVGYSVYQRASFGMFGSFIPILIRSATGLIWIGVQTYQGGMFTAVMLRCIFGHRWHDIANTIPKSSGITTKNLVGTIIFFVLTLPLLAMKIHKLRHLWVFKLCILPLAVIPFFAWTVSLAPNTGTNLFPGGGNLTGSALAWTFLRCVNSAMGKTSPSQQNAPDVSRYAVSRSAPQLSQLVVLPVINTAVACFGIFSTASTAKAWNLKAPIWNPWLLCDAILDRYWSPGARTAIFLVSICWTFSIVVSNIAVNILPFGADMSALSPRYININRGQYVGYCLGLVVQPWYILASASSFMAFLSGYSLFLAAVVGISATDYFWRKGNLHVPSLYTNAPGSAYRYSYGTHWRAMAAFVLSIFPTLPGFAGTFPGNKVALGWTHLYYISWLYCIVSSSLIYLFFLVVVPPKNLSGPRAAKYEQWADEQQALLDGDVTVDQVVGPGKGVDDEEKGKEACGDVLPVV